MKNAFLFFVMLLGAGEGFSCSMNVDQNYTKNSLVAHAASFNDLSLLSTSGLSLTDYSLTSSGGAGGGSCPDYLIVSGRVTLNHSPSALKHCTYSVTVEEKTYIGSDLPDGPFLDVKFTNAVAACSTSLSGIKIPRKLPARIKKPIIIGSGT